MARKAAETDAIRRAVSAQEHAYHQALANDTAGDDRARKMAKVILAILDGGNRL